MIILDQQIVSAGGKLDFPKVLRRSMVGPIVDRASPVYVESHPVVRRGHESIAAITRRHNLTCPANRNVLGGHVVAVDFRSGTAPTKVDRRIDPLQNTLPPKTIIDIDRQPLRDGPIRQAANRTTQRGAIDPFDASDLVAGMNQKFQPVQFVESQPHNPSLRGGRWQLVGPVEPHKLLTLVELELSVIAAYHDLFDAAQPTVITASGWVVEQPPSRIANGPGRDNFRVHVGG